jgi:hypothetical protein
MVNFSKLRLTSEVIEKVLFYQLPFDLEPVDLVQNYLRNALVLSDNDLFKQSYVCEPKHMRPAKEKD